MSERIEDTASTTIDLGDTQSLSGQASHLAVQTSDADHVNIYIDNGTVGGAPATHDQLVDVYNDNTEITGWRRDTTQTGTTGMKLRVVPTGEKLRLDIVDQSGTTTTNTYRLYVEAVVDDQTTVR